MRKIAVFLLIFSILVSSLFCGQTNKAYAAEITLLEGVEIDGNEYKEIEPGMVELVEWKKKSEYKQAVQILVTVIDLDR